MLISDAHKFAFIHVPKTGGDSVTAALKSYAECDGSIGRVKHWTARHLKQLFFREEVGRVWSQYHTFGMIRNPWQQVHSDYWFCRNSPIPGVELGSWRDKVIRAKGQTFAQFVVDICGENGTDGRGLFHTYLAGNDGNQLVSDVIRLEDIATEWPKLCGAIGLPGIELPCRNMTPRRPDYRDDYDDRSRFLVGRKFADDIRRFDYSF